VSDGCDQDERRAGQYRQDTPIKPASMTSKVRLKPMICSVVMDGIVAANVSSLQLK